MGRRAHREAGPVTPGTEQLVGTWTPEATAPATGAVRETGTEPPGRPGGSVRARRRVTTQPVPGSDPSPAPEPRRHREGDNDERMLREKPPHW